MRIPLDNGLYIDPCNPCVLYDSPIETSIERVLNYQTESDIKKLQQQIAELRSKINETEYKDAHFE